MSDHSKETKSIAEKISVFLSAHRTAFVVVSAVIIVGIIASVGIAQYLNARAERSAAAAEEIQSLWEEWQAMQPPPTAEESEPSAEADALEEELRGSIEDARNEFARSYGGMRALLVLGQLEWELGNLDEARIAFETVADESSGTYLEPLALANAAATAEEQGNTDHARELLGRVISLETVANLERSHALFSLGRLAEQQGEDELALDYYNQLLDEHGDSNWTNLGRNRIIWLTSQGVGSES